ncbi:MAG: 2-oxoacid:acceptor oxidoreductase family protein [Candidatus Hodarchaeales archaeon]|jgi:2-oxoglutarate ferredoxin oxidoreductase subunit gamma
MGKAKTGRVEIRIAGFGGQGIILSAVITGKAASIYEGKQATVMEVYGPESRGGASSGTIVVDDDTVDYPYVTHPDIFVVMSQAAYLKYVSELKPGSIMIYDEDLVEPEEDDIKEAELFPIAATKTAERLGRRIVANIVMLGALASLGGVISQKSMKDAILATVPRALELNAQAFEDGYSLAERHKIKD